MTELFDPLDGRWLLNKFEIYKTLRDRDTAYWSEKYQMHVVTRYDDVVYALSNPDIFSSAQGNLIIENDPRRFGYTMGASDNPAHDTYKNIVKEAYSKENIDRVCNLIGEKARELLTGKNEVNISEVIEHLSAWVTAEILNIPHDKEKIKNFIVDIQKHSDQAVKYNTNNDSFNSLREIIFGYVNEEQPALGPGIYKEYIKNKHNKLYLTALFMGPTLSGAASMTSALEFLTLDLFRTDVLDQVINDRSLISNAINESLRYHASTGRFSRTVLKEVELHGVIMKPGDRVALCLDSANRDPRAFPDADSFILNRTGQKHVAFGHGVHACIALAISKSAMQVFLEVLLDIFGKYTVVTENNDLFYVIPASGNNDMISNIVISKA